MSINKTIFSILILALSLTACNNKAKAPETTTPEAHEHESKETTSGKKKSLSPRTDAMAFIEKTHIHINYSSPGVRGRTVFGGLVAYDKVWVTGAHSATSIQFYENVKINGTEITKGKYALFTIPGKDEWTIIINKNFDQHLADDYDETLDMVRIKVIPETLEEIQESLTYKVEQTGKNTGKISISWEKIMVSFNVETL